MMDAFSFVNHPIDPKRDVSRKFPLLGKVLNEKQIGFFSTNFLLVDISQIDGICQRRFSHHSLGKKISSQQAEEIDTIATHYGYKLRKFRSFEKNLTAEQIEDTWLHALAAQQSS